jgi:hypothetical protein
MENEESDLKHAFEQELEKIKAETILSPAYRKKKTIIWAVRTSIVATLFFIFREYKYVRWGLIAYIPLNLFSIITIYAGNIFLKKKIDKTRSKIEEVN